MYIIEKIIKIYSKLINKKTSEFIPQTEDNQELEDILTCKHQFMPIDSTGEIFACMKCGYVVTKGRLNKNRNPFKYQ